MTTVIRYKRPNVVNKKVTLILSFTSVNYASLRCALGLPALSDMVSTINLFIGRLVRIELKHIFLLQLDPSEK